MATRRKAAQVAERTNAVEAGTTPRPPAIKSKFSGVPLGWEPAAQALPKVSAVRTIFPDFNLKSRVGGLPSERVVVVHGATHGGKAMRMDTRILTPLGWRRFGDLKVGDIVTGRDGQPCKVTGVFPQGVKPLYEVKFSDGATAICCAEHLWFTTTKQERIKGAFIKGPRPERKRIATGRVGEGSVKSLAEIAKDPAYTHEIPLVEPVEFQRGKELGMSPYLLGILLGDGSFAGSTPLIHNPEEDIRQKVEQVLPEEDEISTRDSLTYAIRRKHAAHQTSSTTMRVLRELNLNGLESHEKFIPEVYLFASVSERLELLRGLFDTDGHVVEHGTRIEYTTTSPMLAEGVLELVRSLGGIATCRWRTTNFTYKGELKKGKASARINVWFQNSIVPVSSKKHLSRLRPSEDVQRYRRAIVSVKPWKEEECMCIAVDSPDHLYVVDDYVVTHNTAYVIGLIASYLLGGHAVAYVDAEHSTPQEYMAQLVEQVTGTPLDMLQGFFAKRPKNYEDTITDVDRFLAFMKEQRRENPELRALVVLDSINELTPKRELEQMLAGINKESSGEEGAKPKKGPRGGRDKGGDNIDKGWGRVRAQLNAAWLSHLIPRLAEAGCTLVAIAQEKEGEEKEAWEQDLMDEYELLGGKKQKYAASMLLRVVKVRPVKEGEGREAEVLAWEHRVRIWKSKVGPMEGRWTDCTFYLRLDGSFDVARNLIHTGKDLGVIKTANSWHAFEGVRVNGEKALVARLEKDAALLERLTAAVNAAVDGELAKRVASKLNGHEEA